MRERDSQRAKLYRAERVIYPLGKRIDSLPEIRRYIASKVSNRATLKARYGNAVDFTEWPVEVKDGRGASAARGWVSGISLPLWSRFEIVILHELAHTIHRRLWIAKGGKRISELNGGASHGWQFAAIFADLVQFVIGAEAGKALKESFRLNRVRFSKPKTRAPLSSERKAKLIAILAAARAKRTGTSISVEQLNSSTSSP